MLRRLAQQADFRQILSHARMQQLRPRRRRYGVGHGGLACLLEPRSERRLGAMKRPPDFASAVNAGQPTPAPHSAAARPSSSIGGPSAAFSRVISFTGISKADRTV